MTIDHPLRQNTSAVPDGHVDISGKSRAAVLAALFNRARPQGLGFLHATDREMTEVEAQTLLDHGHNDFDYLEGRVMKVNLARNIMRVDLYDRDNGHGAAASAIAEVE